jgi:3-oxoacyl-[acyl-carrier protein] reductase
VTVEQFDTLYNVNIRGMFFLTQAVLPALSAERKGVVINLASIHAFAGACNTAVSAAPLATMTSPSLHRLHVHTGACSPEIPARG